AFRDPALGIAARAQPGARQHFGNPLGRDPLRRAVIPGEARARLWQAVVHANSRHRPHGVRGQSPMTRTSSPVPKGMALALEQAKAAAEQDEVPVGAALFDEDGALIAAFGNRVEQDRDPTAHAELLALRAGAARLGLKRLAGCDLYVSL